MAIVTARLTKKPYLQRSSLVFCKNALKSLKVSIYVAPMCPLDKGMLWCLLLWSEHLTRHILFAFWSWCFCIPLTWGGLIPQIIKTSFQAFHFPGPFLRQSVHMVIYFCKIFKSKLLSHDQWRPLSPLWFLLMLAGFGVCWHFESHAKWKLSWGNV